MIGELFELVVGALTALGLLGGAGALLYLTYTFDEELRKRGR